MLPYEALAKAAREFTDYNGTGMSVMELTHRGKDFKDIIEKAESLLRSLMGVPDNYKVLFLQGGAWLQFAMLPLNLAAVNKKAGYADTGSWAHKAETEAARFINVEVTASSKDRNYAYIPTVPSMAGKGFAYYHICLNNTIFGTKWPSLPDTAGTPLTADISSCALSEPLDVSRFGLLFAGAQKNLGPAGCCVVILDPKLLPEDSALATVPTMLRYDTHIDAASLFNTPPTYTIYIIKLVLEWLKDQGGVPAIAERNRAKAKLLYDFIDNSRLFRGVADKECRSLMNVTFVTGKPDLDKKCVAEAAKAGIVNINGHRSVGGLRASIYNAMPLEGVKALVDFLAKFEKENV
jgi:phosphoserine aminotransferase